MRITVCLLLCLAVVAADWVAPWYYHDLEGPKFANTTIETVQVRNYAADLWANTIIESNDIKEAGSIGFNRLFDYISGANADKITIEMTTPVLTTVQPGAGPNCNSSFTVSFYVPYMYQNEQGPPEPTSEDIFIGKIGPLEVAVSEFSGFTVQSEIIAKTVELEAEVSASSTVKADSNTDIWYFAGYDPPFRITNRHNEVWIPVTVSGSK